MSKAPDLSKLLKNAQTHLMSCQDTLKGKIATVTVPDVIKIDVTCCSRKITALSLYPALMERQNSNLLQECILMTVNAAFRKADSQVSKVIKKKVTDPMFEEFFAQRESEPSVK